MYTVSRDPPNPGISVARACDGARVPTDVNDQGFCDFLTWASTHADPETQELFGLHGPARFFASAPRLTEFYKGSGELLAAKEGLHPGDKGWGLLLGRRFHATSPWGEFYNLLKAVAPPEGAGGTVAGGLAPKECKTWVTAKLTHELNESLGNEDSDIRRLSTWPIERCFVYLDVSDFSKYPPGQECLIINSLVRTARALADSKVPEIARAVADQEASLCIGDGYIYVFKRPLFALIFASCLAYLIEMLVARKALPVGYHFRMSVHAGPVYSFWDPGRGGWNYIGEGINGGQRVLGAIGKDVDDVLFVSAQIKQNLAADHDGAPVYAALLNSLQNRGRRTDKHDTPWRVYEVNHTNAASALFADVLRVMSG